MSEITPRLLTQAEHELADYLICYSPLISTDEKHIFRDQLKRACVSSKCDCGCASIGFAIEGMKQPKGGLRPLSEATASDNKYGIFIYECAGILSGLEIYGLADLELPKEFPPLSEIKIQA